MNHLHQDLVDGAESNRLRAALAIGTACDQGALELIVERCGVEPDFYVRDMLTWALTRLPKELVFPLIVQELDSAKPQARSQALHTLSKFRDPSTWNAIRTSHLRDPNDEVARTAWRAAVLLVPRDKTIDLASELSGQFGLRSQAARKSLSQALVDLGEDAVTHAKALAIKNGSPEVVIHALATELMLHDSELGFDGAMVAAAHCVVSKES